MAERLRVGLNGAALAGAGLRGWSRYTLNLARALCDLPVDLVLYADRPLDPKHLAALPSARVRQAPPMVYAMWQEVWLPRAARDDGIQVLHSPINFGLPWRRPCPTVLTLHDAIDAALPARSLRPRVVISGLYRWIARRRATHVITPSQFSKQDIVRRWGLPAERISVIAEGADPRFHQAVSDAERARVRTSYSLDRPYLFYVGGFEPRKNLSLLVQAYAQAALSGVLLLLAGGEPDLGAGLASLAATLGVGRSVQLIGPVPDDDLPALYAEALCYVYPSRYEGFGLQLCEAMAVGCPTMAARATSLPEVLGDGGATFDPRHPEELAGLLARVAGDSRFRNDLADRARLRSQAFSWRRCAEQTFELYQRLARSA